MKVSKVTDYAALNKKKYSKCADGDTKLEALPAGICSLKK